MINIVFKDGKNFPIDNKKEVEETIYCQGSIDLRYDSEIVFLFIYGHKAIEIPRNLINIQYIEKDNVYQIFMVYNPNKILEFTKKINFSKFISK